MHRALSKMQSHRPVIGNCVYDILHACVQSSLSRPDVRADNRNVLGYILKDSRHQFSVLLVGCVVGELFKAGVVNGLPDSLIKDLTLLGKSRAQGVQIVLCGDDLRTCSFGV